MGCLLLVPGPWFPVDSKTSGLSPTLTLPGYCPLSSFSFPKILTVYKSRQAYPSTPAALPQFTLLFFPSLFFSHLGCLLFGGGSCRQEHLEPVHSVGSDIVCSKFPS